MSTTILELRLELGYSYKYASAARDRVCNWIFSHFRRLWCMYPSPSKWITISCGFSLSKHKLIAACLSLWSQDTNKESSQSKSATTFGWMDMSKRSTINHAMKLLFVATQVRLRYIDRGNAAHIACNTQGLTLWNSKKYLHFLPTPLVWLSSNGIFLPHFSSKPRSLECLERPWKVWRVTSYRKPSTFLDCSRCHWGG